MAQKGLHHHSILQNLPQEIAKTAKDIIVAAKYNNTKGSNHNSNRGNE